MASARSFVSEEQFLCSICLDVFNHPVTIPCGHNYCKTCITKHWDGSDICKCPLCNKVFYSTPELPVNTFISEMADQFRKSVAVKDSSRPGQPSGGVLCDICTGTKTKAVKSCLTCVASYCETHLEPHQRVAGLKRHKLVDPVDNLEDRMCKKHDRPLELFCKVEEVCVCQFCSESDHKLHPVVPLKEGYEGKKAQLGQKDAEVQQMIRERRLKVQQIQRSVKLSNDDADREIAHGVEVFTAVKHYIEKGQAELIATVEDQHRSTEMQAEGFIKELEQEITELTKRSSELERLSHIEDPLHLLQSLPSLNTPHPRDWSKVNFHRPSYVGTVRGALDQLEKTLNMETKKLCAKAELKKVQQDTVDVTLDARTAHPQLVLSVDGKQVYDNILVYDIIINSAHNPERFSHILGVLGKQCFSSGRFYYEVEVKGKTGWRLGVAKESITRNGSFALIPNNGLWTVHLEKGNECYASTDSGDIPCVTGKLQKVGVFVDYEEGLVSFYDVKNRVHIYSFSGCSFTEPLYPFFNPWPHNCGENSAPLIITPVNKSD